MKKNEFLGIALGAIYGLVIRVLCERNPNVFDFNVFSVTFLWVLPIAIGVIPILVANKELLNAPIKQFLYPIFSVWMFFTAAIATGLEDLICILILTIPFTAVAGVTGVVAAYFIKNKNRNKFYSILLFPFFLPLVESNFSNKTALYSISSNVEIQASAERVWQHLIEVPEILETEYPYGFFNYIGIPRPIRSQLETINGQAYRVGYFTQNLKLVERITEKIDQQYVAFQIDLEKSELRDLPTDRHILQSGYFKFDTIAYELFEKEDGKIILKLSCSYQINSKMNGYANFWAKQIIQDFEEKLLSVLKQKIESK